MNDVFPYPVKQDSSPGAPHRRMGGHKGTVYGVLRLPGGQLIITCSHDGSLRVWDLESNTQVGNAWQDEGSGGVPTIALSPDGKKVASGSEDGAIRLWDVDTGKVIKKWTGHTRGLWSVCWSPDGERVTSGSLDGTFRVWNVASGETILGPIEAGGNYGVWAVCYSPDGKKIATGGRALKIWSANTGKLLKTVKMDSVGCLAWTSEGSTLIAGSRKIRKFDTATWTEIAVLDEHKAPVNTISLSPNNRVLVSVSCDKTAQLWNLDNNQPIGPPLHHETWVECAAFSANGKLLVTGCYDDNIYTWDVSAILREACLDDLLLHNNTDKPSVLDGDAIRRALPIQGAHRIRRGFFDDADFSTSHMQRDHHSAATRQRTLFDRRRSNSNGATEHDTQSPLHLLSWVQHFVSGILRRREIELRESHVVDVPYTASKPRNYHARKKTPVSSSRLPNTHTNRASLQQTTSAALPAAAMATGTPSHLDITIRQAGFWTRFLLCVGCVSVQYTDGQH